MSETKHTPGPWAWKYVVGAGLQVKAVLPGHKDGYTFFEGPANAQSCLIGFASWSQFSTQGYDDEQKANAALIAAAPETAAELVAVKAELARVREADARLLAVAKKLLRAERLILPDDDIVSEEHSGEVLALCELFMSARTAIARAEEDDDA